MRQQQSTKTLHPLSFLLYRFPNILSICSDKSPFVAITPPLQLPTRGAKVLEKSCSLALHTGRRSIVKKPQSAKKERLKGAPF
ncbi:hypothetical protein HMPREF0262_01509 [Clostridium sp. ATCC 29733]|nr:hypothetical protein HMPREF0262_01509 [Clostridium sp. ATCC 29733]